MQIPPEIIDKIRQAADIVDIIGSYITLKKKGANYWGPCPFHSEKTASFSVSPAKQIFKCFGCGEGGNVFTFLQKYDGLSFPEAVRQLGKKYNIEIPENELTPEELEKIRLCYVQQLIFSDNIRLTKPLKNILSPEVLPPEIRSWNNITLAMLLPAISSGMNCNGRGTTCNYFRIIP